MNTSERIKQILGYIFIAYALFGMICLIYYQFGINPMSPEHQSSFLYNPPHFMDHGGIEISTIIVFYGFSAVAGAILLTNTKSKQK